MASKTPKLIPRDYEPHSAPPSSGTAGFFQATPKLENAFHEDETLKRVFAFYLPEETQDALRPDLSRFGSLVISPSTLALNTNAEKHPPYIRAFDTWGRRVDELVTSRGWQELQNIGLAEGIVAIPYENKYGPHSRLYQFLKYVMWSSSSATVTCPSAMQDGAATLLRKQLANKDLPEAERQVFQKAFDHLISQDPSYAWTSGQWMTERAGGSDVRGTETLATYTPEIESGSSTTDVDGTALGPWSISGFKWFASAVDSQMAIMLARMPSGSVSAFYAPLKRRNPSSNEPEYNGLNIQHLKEKLGTRSLPSAELILRDTRAYLVGQPGQGVKEISALLNITRLHNSVAAIGGWSRGLSISCAFTRVRKARGQLLIDNPLHVRTLAAQHVTHRAMAHLTFFAALLLGVTEYHTYNRSSSPSDPPSTPPSHLYTPSSAPHLLRLLTPLAKALTAKAAIAGLAEVMESLGGVGYIENADIAFNAARLFRDANVLSIWEGTTNVLADDAVRVVKGREGGAVLGAWDGFVQAAVRAWREVQREGWRENAVRVERAWGLVREKVEGRGAEELRHQGREVLWEMGWVVCAVLLGEDARSDGDVVAEEVWRRYCGDRSEEADWKTEALWDRKIVFGDESRAGEKARL